MRTIWNPRSPYPFVTMSSMSTTMTTYEADNETSSIDESGAGVRLDPQESCVRLDSQETAHPEINLKNLRTREPLAFSTVAGRIGIGGTDAIREYLGFSEWNSPGEEEEEEEELSAEALKALNHGDQNLGEVDKSMDEVELQNLGQGANEAKCVVETIMSDNNPPPLQAMTRVRDELVNNAAKLSTLDDDVGRIKKNT
ncbi:hypothetical protein ElyMa_001795400 [Elysia marginata]|uniref:Uncharacterized protein n=1 Tax=Elysia marginata TaxID=1093978 RepID=A0AAV4EES5_9GAST|nr:hypothetical protein ElyMa_001795400 [Elysia marginata]